MKPNYFKTTPVSPTNKTDRYDIAKILCQILFFSKNLVTWKIEELSHIKTYTIIHTTGWSRSKKRKKKKINDRAR